MYDQCSECHCNLPVDEMIEIATDDRDGEPVPVYICGPCQNNYAHDYEYEEESDAT